MHMIPVVSSSLVAVGYNPQTMTLRIQFYSRTYDYYNVPKSIFDGLLCASSKSNYHHSFIKNSFKRKRIG